MYKILHNKLPNKFFTMNPFYLCASVKFCGNNFLSFHLYLCFIFHLYQPLPGSSFFAQHIHFHIFKNYCPYKLLNILKYSKKTFSKASLCLVCQLGFSIE